jgi:16S rRNA (guanine527-N7)-methyltransferase
VEDLPDLPAAYTAALDTGLSDLGLALPAPARRRIDDQARLLLTWNSAINLTAIREPAEVARLHVLDSLTSTGVLRGRAIDAFVDIGSGGGYPGMPVACALPARTALLVESVGKKARFLETAARAIGMDRVVRVAAERAEDVARDRLHRENWPAVLARAVGDLGELVELAFPLLEPGGILVAWKRRDIADEMRRGERAAESLGGGSIEVVDTGVSSLRDHRLVLVTKTGRTGGEWPRNRALRLRCPW